MKQLTVFDLLDGLPQAGDHVDSLDGKVKIIGIKKDWKGREHMIYTVSGFGKSMPLEEFKEWLKRDKEKQHGEKFNNW